MYACTAFASVFAYGWLVVVLQVLSPDMIEPWEGLVTFLFFPLLVAFAYLLDIRYFDRVGSKKHKQDVLAGAHVDVADGEGCKLHPALVAHVVRQIKSELVRARAPSFSPPSFCRRLSPPPASAPAPSPLSPSRPRPHPWSRARCPITHRTPRRTNRRGRTCQPTCWASSSRCGWRRCSRARAPTTASRRRAG